jgi:ATP:cob(I)alamin adenosyltransferase
MSKELTTLKSGANLPKNDPLVHAIGEIEELNATIGVALAYIWDNSDAMHLLMDVQNDLVVAINDLHHSGVKYDNRMKNERHRAIQEAAKRINLDLIEPKGEIIPGGTPASAHCHLARAVCRIADNNEIDLVDHLVVMGNLEAVFAFFERFVVINEQTNPVTHHLVSQIDFRVAEAFLLQRNSVVTVLFR